MHICHRDETLCVSSKAIHSDERRPAALRALEWEKR
jgi:hypothetical protein